MKNNILAFLIGLTTVISGYLLYEHNKSDIISVGSDMTGSVWFLNTSSQIQTALSTWGLRIPSLANCDTIDTNASGVFACGSDSGGAGGSGSISTSTTPTPGELAFWTSNSALSSVATGTLTENATGLEFNATRGLVGGASILSLTTGYNIPLTASTTEWGDFIATPSSLCEAITGSADLCDGGDATGGSGVLSTSTPWTAGELAYVINGNTIASVATGTLTESVTGLELNATRGLVGGAAILAITSGYGIPLTASTTEWYNFHTTPSGRITAGTGIDWSSNTLNGVYTAGDALTLTGEDFDFDGGASPSGDLGGTWASPSVTDDSHAHTGTTLSGIDISSDTNLSADGTEIVLTGDALSLGTALTFTTGTSSTSFFSALGTFTNSVINTLLTAAAATFTGLVDIGAGVLEIPNGTAPTADDVGELAHDTSSSTNPQLILDDFVVAKGIQKIWSVTVASTSVAFLNSGLLPIPPDFDGYTITDIVCKVDSGTSKVIAVEDASANATEDITCTTSTTQDDGSITNATATPLEEMYIDFGATSGSVDYVTVTVYGTRTRE